MHLFISVTNRHDNRVVTTDIWAIFVRAAKCHTCYLEDYSFKEILINFYVLLTMELNIVNAVICCSIIYLLAEVNVKEILDILTSSYMVKLVIPRLIFIILLIILNRNIELNILAIVACLPTGAI